MLTLKYFAYSVDMWSHSSVGMSCDFIYYFLIGHKMVMVHFYQLVLNIDDVCLKLYTIFSKKPKCTLFAGSTVHVHNGYIMTVLCQDL